MYAPGFVTGSLIKRFGVLPAAGRGRGAQRLCVAIALSGVELMHFVGAGAAGRGLEFSGSPAAPRWRSRPTAPKKRPRKRPSSSSCVFATMSLTSFASRAGHHAGLGLAERRFAGAAGGGGRGAGVAGRARPRCTHGGRVTGTAVSG